MGDGETLESKDNKIKFLEAQNDILLKQMALMSRTKVAQYDSQAGQVC